MLNRSITVKETVNVLDDVRTLLKKNGNSKKEIDIVESVLLTALGAPTVAEVITHSDYYIPGKEEQV